jgi:SAM-dependent methyltransferase
MGPLLFEPYAKVLAERAALLQPDRILETAAGTGILTRALHGTVPHAQIVATDVNPVMLEAAAQRLGSDHVFFQQADAQHLPFDDESFDLVVCQFGVMFFPEKVRAHAEARRVLRANGHYLVVSFDRLELNPVPEAARNAVAALFPDDPPAYMERGPFSYVDRARIEHAAVGVRVALLLKTRRRCPRTAVDDEGRRADPRGRRDLVHASIVVDFYPADTARGRRDRGAEFVFLHGRGARRNARDQRRLDR